ncbi:MAG: NRDE family protein, partial [Porticoccaceae bacterium]|nr:NRDE family protein [Porticoccaceae bacterium]
MCTLSWIQHQDSYSLVFNRDELNSRQRALPPALKTALDGSRYLSPTDTDAGGSWLQVNEHGLTACLLNYYAADTAPSDDVHSRGE